MVKSKNIWNSQIFFIYYSMKITREQLRKIDEVTDNALTEIEAEREDKPRDYIAEWFKWVEKVGKYLRKHILH